MFFSAINPAATVFGAAFVAQGLLLLGLGGVGHSFRVGPRGGFANVAGWALVVYSLLLYPILGRLQGHGYPAGPSFGAPCPMTIFFLGIMLWSTPRVPVTLVVIPLLWTVVASTAALELGILEDLGLAVAALAVVVTVAHQRVHGIGRPAHPLTA
jgi:hypothetical protein